MLQDGKCYGEKKSSRAKEMGKARMGGGDLSGVVRQLRGPKDWDFA